MIFYDNVCFKDFFLSLVVIFGSCVFFCSTQISWSCCNLFWSQKDLSSLVAVNMTQNKNGEIKSILHFFFTFSSYCSQGKIVFFKYFMRLWKLITVFQMTFLLVFFVWNFHGNYTLIHFKWLLRFQIWQKFFETF